MMTVVKGMVEQPNHSQPQGGCHKPKNVSTPSHCCFFLFRALGTVCCVLEGIMELEEAGGIEILSDTLRDADATEEEKSEAAGLLAQVLQERAMALWTCVHEGNRKWSSLGDKYES